MNYKLTFCKYTTDYLNFDFYINQKKVKALVFDSNNSILLFIEFINKIKSNERIELIKENCYRIINNSFENVILDFKPTKNKANLTEEMIKNLEIDKNSFSLYCESQRMEITFDLFII